MSYLKTVYNRERARKSNYPKELVGYLIRRFSLKKGHKLLEIGVGNADFLIEFNRKGLKTFGVDKEISQLIEKSLNIKKIDLTKQKLPFSDNSIDVVYHKSVLEHFYRDEAEFIMRETKRVLKKGGKLIILVPEWTSQMQTFFEDYTHVHPYDNQSISDILKIYNFSNVLSEDFYQLPQIWKYPQLKYFAKVLSFFMTTKFARRLTTYTGLKFFRWSKELMVLGYGENK